MCTPALYDEVTLWPLENLIYYCGLVFTSAAALALRGKHNSPYGHNVKSGLSPFKLWASDA